jgi:hypothetical protein
MSKHDSPGSSWTPGAESKERLIAAAMAHFEDSGIGTFLVPVPGTNPPLFVALGTLAQLESALAARSDLTDN